MTKWILREVRVPDGGLDDKIRWTVFTAVDGMESRFSRPGLRYLDCRESLLSYANAGDTYAEESLNGRSTDEFEIVVEDHEVGNLRISDRPIVTFEGWRHQWNQRLALYIDNDPDALRMVCDIAGEIIDANLSSRNDMARVFRDRVRSAIDPGQRVLTGKGVIGWTELLQHYTGKVLEERKYEESD